MPLPSTGRALYRPAKTMPAKLVSNIKSFGVNAAQPFHPGDQVGPWRFQDEMKVIGHEAVGMHFPVGLRPGLREGFEKEFAILVGAKYVVALVAAIHDVIHRAGIFYSELTGHCASDITEPGECQ